MKIIQAIMSAEKEKQSLLLDPSCIVLHADTTSNKREIRLHIMQDPLAKKKRVNFFLLRSEIGYVLQVPENSDFVQTVPLSHPTVCHIFKEFFFDPVPEGD